jgi:uncharacterized protein YjdB
MKRSFSLLVGAALLCASATALGTPYLRGDAPMDWTVGAVMLDTGVAPDAVAGDGIYAVNVTFPAVGTYGWKVYDDDGGGTWYGELTGANMAVTTTVAGEVVTFYFDGRSLSDRGWLPAHGTIGESKTAASTWVAVGNFQLALGDTGDWNNASTITVAHDDGRFGDVQAGDGIYTYRFFAPAAITAGLFKFTRQGTWNPEFGAAGWMYTGAGSDGTFTAAAGDMVTLEFNAKLGHIRARVSSGPVKLLISEVAIGPGNPPTATSAEYLEIFNPGADPVYLADYFISDNSAYYQLVRAAEVGGSGTPPDFTTSSTGADFLMRFPVDAVIAPGQYQTLAVYSANDFQAAYSTLPTYENLPALVSGTGGPAAGPNLTALDMVKPYATCIANGSTRAPTLTNGSELAILFYWNGFTDVVTDVDYVYWGTTSPIGATNLPLAKTTAICEEGPDPDATATCYPGSDTADAIARHARVLSGGNCLVRQDYAETGQPASGGNGIGGRDEAGEPWFNNTTAVTWRGCLDVNKTPNGPSANALVLSPTPTATIIIGGSLQFTAAAYADLGLAFPMTPTFTWTSPTANHISFNAATQTATGTSVGTGDQVTVAAGDLSATTTVTITYKSIAVTCGKSTLQSTVGSTTCTAKAYDATDAEVAGATFTWDITSGAASGSVDSTGLVTAAAAGVLVVRARGTGDAVTQGTYTISVEDPALTALHLSVAAAQCPSIDCLVGTAGSEWDVADHGDVIVTVDGVDQFGNPITVSGETFTLGAPAVAHMIGRTIVGDVVGTTTLTAHLGGAVADNTLTFNFVARAPNTLVIGNLPGGNTIAQGGTATLTAAVTDQFGAAMTGLTIDWTSDAPGVVAVDSSGGLSGAIPPTTGDAHITATVHGTTVSQTVIIHLATATSVVTTVTLSPASVSLQAGNDTPLTATARDQFDAAMAGVLFDWSSDNTGAATVSVAGLVHGVAPGAATITATAQGTAVSGTAAVTVTAIPPVLHHIIVTPGSVTGHIGDVVNFSAKGYTAADVEISGLTFTWTSDDTGVVSVIPGTGAASAVGLGSTLIHATSGAVVGDASVTITAVIPPVDHIVVTPSPLALDVGANATLSATAYAADDSTIPTAVFVWGSADTAVATVDASGQVAGVAAGSTTITVTSGSATADVPVTVNAVLDHIVVAPTAASVAVGATQGFTATGYDVGGNAIVGLTFAWTSGDTAVATVDSTGTATALAVGTVSIRAAVSQVHADATLTVTAAPTIATVTVSPPSASVVVGGDATFSAQVFDADGNLVVGATVTWVSSDDAVATVAGGVAHGVASGGPVTITATADGTSVSGTASLTVTELPTAIATIAIAPATASVHVTGTQQLAATAYDAQGDVVAGVAFDWSSTDEAVATVTSSGLATGASVGSATITAVPQGAADPAGTATLTVTSITYMISGTTLDASGDPVPGVDVTVAGHDDWAVVTGADGTYRIQGVAPGTYELTATLAGYRTAQATVEVVGQNVLQNFLLETTASSGCGCRAGGDRRNTQGGLIFVGLSLVGLLAARRRRG